MILPKASGLALGPNPTAIQWAPAALSLGGRVNRALPGAVQSPTSGDVVKNECTLPILPPHNLWHTEVQLCFETVHVYVPLMLSSNSSREDLHDN